MTVLYIDAACGSSPEMLLGALIDMGASPGYIQMRLQESGVDTEILHSGVVRDGMEGTLAYCTGDVAAELAVFVAIESFSPEYIICGNMPEHTDKAEKELMDKIANRYGTPPEGFIMCDGYGADLEEKNQGLLRCVLYNCGDAYCTIMEFAKEADMGMYV